MKMSSMEENDVGTYKGSKFIVVDICPEDRSSGVTTIQYENGGTGRFIWDHDNPEVEFIGKGKLKVEIIVEEEKTPTTEEELHKIKTDVFYLRKQFEKVLQLRYPRTSAKEIEQYARGLFLGLDRVLLDVELRFSASLRQSYIMDLNEHISVSKIHDLK